jgi:hypothetical protein
LVTCAQCRRGFQQAAGERIEVSPEIIEMAACDAQCIGQVEATPAPTQMGQPDAELEPKQTHVGLSTKELNPLARVK